MRKLINYERKQNSEFDLFMEEFGTEFTKLKNNGLSIKIMERTASFTTRIPLEELEAFQALNILGMLEGHRSLGSFVAKILRIHIRDLTKKDNLNWRVAKEMLIHYRRSLIE